MAKDYGQDRKNRYRRMLLQQSGDSESTRLFWRVVMNPKASAAEREAAEARLLEIKRARYGPDFPPGLFKRWMYGRQGPPPGVQVLEGD